MEKQKILTLKNENFKESYKRLLSLYLKIKNKIGDNFMNFSNIEGFNKINYSKNNNYFLNKNFTPRKIIYNSAKKFKDNEKNNNDIFINNVKLTHLTSEKLFDNLFYKKKKRENNIYPNLIKNPEIKYLSGFFSNNNSKIEKNNLFKRIKNSTNNIKSRNESFISHNENETKSIIFYSRPNSSSKIIENKDNNEFSASLDKCNSYKRNKKLKSKIKTDFLLQDFSINVEAKQNKKLYSLLLGQKKSNIKKHIIKNNFNQIINNNKKNKNRSLNRNINKYKLNEYNDKINNFSSMMIVNNRVLLSPNYRYHNKKVLLSKGTMTNISTLSQNKIKTKVSYKNLLLN